MMTDRNGIHRTNGHSRGSRWQHVTSEILNGLDIRHEYAQLGVQTVGRPNSKGWDQVDGNRSAYVNVGDGPLRGRYKDFGGNGLSCTLFDYAVQQGRAADWKAARRAYAQTAGVTLPRVGRAGAPERIEDKLAFREWHEGLVNSWCMHKPGTTVEGAQLCGARLGAWPKASREFHVIAFPVFGINGVDADPHACVLLNRTGRDILIYQGPGRARSPAKSVTVRIGEREAKGWIGFHGLAHLEQAEFVWKVEGVTDLVALQSIIPVDLRDTHVAITNIAGTNEIPVPELVELLSGKTVFVLHDMDRPGQGCEENNPEAHGAVRWVQSIRQHAQCVNVQLPYQIEHKSGRDVRDWINEGGTYQQLLELANQALVDAPPVPAEQPSTEELSALLTTISNYEETYDEEGKRHREPLSMATIIERIIQKTDGWPRRCGPSLFVPGRQTEVDWLLNARSLFGWLHTQSSVEWARGDGYVEKGELAAEISRIAECFDAVESLPHEPPLSGHYYTCPQSQPGDGECLQDLLSRFRVATDIDRDLLLAMFVTPFWGGPPGMRPAFVLTSDTGRGAGKSKTAELNARLMGGFIDVSAGEDIGVVKQRLLSPDAMHKRIAILDNIKSLRFSWAELESLITSNVISGKRMYVGEASRPNVLTWYITLNGVSLATDMAQRSVILKVVKGRNEGTWYEDTAQFIDSNRERLIADAIGFLQGERFPLAAYSRWASWEHDILSRLPEPNEAQSVILERQAESDAEADETDLIRDFVEDKLIDLHYSPQSQQIRIPVAILADWVRQATGDKQAKTAGISRHLNQLAGEGALVHLRPDSSRTYGRCFVWVGSESSPDEEIRSDLASRVELRKR